MPTRRKNQSRARQRRLRDFEKRLAADGGNPPALAPYECVLVHPLADDHELLVRIEWSSEKCTSVDAYWRLGNDVVFLQVCSPWPGGPGTGLYAQRDPSDGRLALTAVLAEEKPVDSEMFGRVMERFVEVRWKGADILHAPVGSRGATRVGDI